MEFNLEKTKFNKTVAPYIGKTAKLMNMHISDILQDNNIPVTKEQWLLLKVLCEVKKGVIQNDLAFITERNKASLTRLINVMEKKNLVVRTLSMKDTRKKIVHITDEGNKLYIKTEPLLLKCILNIQKGISNNELRILKETLNKIQINIKNQS